MYVYSKWGDVLFYSDDYDVQWDGRDEGGDFVPQGVYVYYVQYANGTQELLSKRGLVTVLYAE
jgi:flagellar hook assembly protein FlgD